MEVKVFGPNLQDQSKGSFVVHAADCKDCKKLHKRNEQYAVRSIESYTDVVNCYYADQIREGSCTFRQAINDIHFSPCVKIRDN